MSIIYVISYNYL